MKSKDPNIPFRTAGVSTMLVQCQKMERHLSGARSGEAPEELRRMRVATRRLRAAMKVFRSTFPPRRYDRWYSRVSELTDALGAVRDVDVQTELVLQCSENLPSEQRNDVDRFLFTHHLRGVEVRGRLSEILDLWDENGYLERLQSVITATGGQEDSIVQRATSLESELMNRKSRDGTSGPDGEAACG